MAGLQKSAKKIAAKGRNGDNTLVHMSKGEVRGLQQLAKAHGTSLTKNPDTGLAEAFSLKSLLGPIGTVVGGVFGGPVGAQVGGMLGGALSGSGKKSSGGNAQAQQNAILQEQWKLNKPALEQGVGAMTKMATPEGVQTTRTNMLGFLDQYGNQTSQNLDDYINARRSGLEQRVVTQGDIAGQAATRNLQRFGSVMNPNALAAQTNAAALNGAALRVGGLNDIVNAAANMRYQNAQDLAERRLGVNNDTENMFWGRATDLAKVGQNAAGSINQGYGAAANAANEARRLDQAANTAQGQTLAGLVDKVPWGTVGGWFGGGSSSGGSVLDIPVTTGPNAGLPFSKGGKVNGPGTETSDSVPARLSDGEYVLNAEAVKLIGKKKLDKWNKEGLMRRGGSRGLSKVKNGVVHAGDGWFVGAGMNAQLDKYAERDENKRRWGLQDARAQGEYDLRMGDRKALDELNAEYQDTMSRVQRGDYSTLPQGINSPESINNYFRQKRSGLRGQNPLDYQDYLDKRSHQDFVDQTGRITADAAWKNANKPEHISNGTWIVDPSAKGGYRQLYTAPPMSAYERFMLSKGQQQEADLIEMRKLGGDLQGLQNTLAALDPKSPTYARDKAAIEGNMRGLYMRIEALNPRTDYGLGRGAGKADGTWEVKFGPNGEEVERTYKGGTPPVAQSLVIAPPPNHEDRTKGKLPRQTQSGGHYTQQAQSMRDDPVQQRKAELLELINNRPGIDPGLKAKYQLELLQLNNPSYGLPLSMAGVR